MDFPPWLHCRGPDTDRAQGWINACRRPGVASVRRLAGCNGQVVFLVMHANRYSDEAAADLVEIACVRRSHRQRLAARDFSGLKPPAVVRRGGCGGCSNISTFEANTAAVVGIVAGTSQPRGGIASTIVQRSERYMAAGNSYNDGAGFPGAVHVHKTNSRLSTRKPSKPAIRWKRSQRPFYPNSGCLQSRRLPVPHQSGTKCVRYAVEDEHDDKNK